MIEVGEYVRTKNGIIDRVKTINRYGTVTKYDDKEDKISIATNYYINSGLEVNKDDIVKHSKIISEVAEVGDYVNGKLIHKIDKGQNYCYLYYGNCKTFVDYQIKTILTKEAYQANCYTVERKKEWKKI